MLTRIGDMRSREVISVRDGSRIGFLGDIEIDTQSASLAAIVVYGRSRFFGLFGHEDDCVISWSDIATIGDDAVLVDFTPQKRPPKRGFLANFWENG
ncbi:MAG: YlmC/YmxH family sporulation protein [Ruminococcus bromii]|nr:YlmC/YmxH family sporulation protein [Ruminococcus bromii]